MSRCAASRRKTGDAIGCSEKTVDVTLVCTCGVTQTAPFVMTRPFKEQAKEESCLFCGKLGMKQKGVAA